MEYVVLFLIIVLIALAICLYSKLNNVYERVNVIDAHYQQVLTNIKAESTIERETITECIDKLNAELNNINTDFSSIKDKFGTDNIVCNINEDDIKKIVDSVKPAKKTSKSKLNKAKSDDNK